MKRKVNGFVVGAAHGWKVCDVNRKISSAFWSGSSHMFDLYGVSYRFPKLGSSKDDVLATRSDFATVGNEIRSALRSNSLDKELNRRAS